LRDASTRDALLLPVCALRAGLNFEISLVEVPSRPAAAEPAAAAGGKGAKGEAAPAVGVADAAAARTALPETVVTPLGTMAPSFPALVAGAARVERACASLCVQPPRRVKSGGGLGSQSASYTLELEARLSLVEADEAS
jgi:hypothetical protein